MWYVLQTLTGKEESLVQMIKKIVSKDSYEDCFVAYYERIWRLKQQSIIHVERLFPGYVFILSDTPKELFLQLKKVPTMSKLMSDGGFTFLTLEKEEVVFLENMLGQNRIVQLSYIETDGNGRILSVAGPLKNYMAQVIKFQFKKRYVLIRLRMFGVEKTIVLGIVLNEDLKQEIDYGKAETPPELPEVYSTSFSDDIQSIAAGDCIKVITGTLENMSGVIYKIKKKQLK